MLEKFSYLIRVLLITICGALLGDLARAQQPKPMPAKSDVSTSCDGALDIVPSKPMTFARKRRPSNGPKPADAKDAPTDKQPAGVTKKGV